MEKKEDKNTKYTIVEWVEYLSTQISYQWSNRSKWRTWCPNSMEWICNIDFTVTSLL